MGISRQSGTPTFALGMVAAAWLIGLAVYWNRGFYSRVGLLLVSAAILVCAGATLLPPSPSIDRWSSRISLTLIVCGLLLESVLLWSATPLWLSGLLLIGVGALGALQALELGRLRPWLLGLGLCVFCAVAAEYIQTVAKDPQIDVFVFQQMAASGLLRGINPYTPGYPNIYDAHTPFYGAGVLDAATNRLTVGFPYPPLCLLLILPGYLLGGDCRYADIVAVGGTAWLMAAASRSRWSGAVAFLFLLTPLVLYVIASSWTDTLLAFTFSLVMFCALRYRRGLPYALGLFAATKQYSILAMPMIVMLLKPSDGWREGARLIGTAVVVAALLTVPFWLWDPAAFWRSIVEFQFMQARRIDSLSHLVWMRAKVPWIPYLSAAPVAAAIAAMALVLRRPVRSPARFAGAVTLVLVVFFAFNDPAFANYYYFVIATAAWAAAAAHSDRAPEVHA